MANRIEQLGKIAEYKSKHNSRSTVFVKKMSHKKWRQVAKNIDREHPQTNRYEGWWL